MYPTIPVNAKRIALAIAAALMVVGSAAHAAGPDPVKCRRAIAKNAAGFEAAKIKALQKCEDGKLKGKVPSCPDSKASDKIAKAQQKLMDKVGGACTGLSLTDMNFAGLAKQCSAGFFPGQSCNSAADCAGECAISGLACYSDAFCGANGPCTGLGSCNPVDYCPSVQNDAASEPFGLTPSTDCYFPLTTLPDDVASCVACVGEQTVDQLIGDYYGTANPPSDDKGTLKCQRTVGKSAAKHFAAVRKALQKCQDAVIKAGSGSCPDSKASDKISKSQATLAGKISGACSDAQLASGFVVSELLGVSGRPDAACATLDPTTTSIAAAIQCLTEATAEANDALGVGSSPQSSNPLCGNSHLDAGENCDDGNTLQESGVGPADFCPVDCTIAACTPSGSQSSATVSFTASADATGLTVVVYYDESKVVIPGVNSDPPVQNSVSSLSFAMTPVDTGYALRNVLVDPFLVGVPSGEAFTITFDNCTGAPALSAADLKCFVADATDAASMPLPGTTCSVTVP